MDWGRVRFFLSEVWRNVTRNLVMQLTAVGTVAVTIALLGSFLFTREALSQIGTEFLKEIEISVFLSDKATPADAKALATKLAGDPRVLSATYVSKAAGLADMRKRFAGQIDTSLLTSNPLPEALRVRVRDASLVHAVAASVRKSPLVANVEYAHDAVERLLRLSEVLGRIGLGIVALLIVTAGIIIANTIRLTVFARRREIAIMRLVGASALYVRMPFICEGLIAGVLGAALAVGALELGRVQLLPKLVLALGFLPLHALAVNQTTLALELLGVGAAMGIVASWFSVGRYLRA